MWKKFLARYELIEDVLAGIGLICGVGIMFVGVVSRYVFNHPLTFVVEVGPIFIVWSTFVGYSIALRKDEHIKMDILYLAVKGKWKRAMDLFSYICGIVFAFFMMRYGFLAMMMQRNMNRVTQILEIPVWITYIIIPFIGAVLLIRYIGMIVVFFRPRSAENASGSESEASGG